jgi:hypothetical protein
MQFVKLEVEILVRRFRMEVQVDLDSFLLSSSYIKTKFTEQLKLNSKHLKRVVLRRASIRPLSLGDKLDALHG